MVSSNSHGILRVELSKGTFRVSDLEKRTLKEYIGGLGLNVKLLYDEVGPDVGAFDADNLVLVTPGALTGTAAPTSPRLEVTTKSPLTGLIGTGNVGGHWGPRLKRAGYESVVIGGISEKPVYLIVDHADVSILDASDLWGLDAWETTDYLVEELGEDFSVMAIGIAGERLVRFAAPVFDKQHMPGRCHAGAVLGSKRLKAIAVRGTGEVPVYDPEGFKEVVEKAEVRIRAFPGWPSRAVAGSMGGVGEGWQGVDYEELTRRYTRRGAPGVYCPCMMEPLYGCNLVTNIEKGPHAGTTVVCAGLSLYSAIAEQLRISLPASYRINDLCQRYGMDMYGTLYFAIELFQRGVIDGEDLGGVDLGLGNEEGFYEVLDMIAHRRGMGDILAEGAVRAAAELGRGARGYLSEVKGLESMMLDPRAMLKDSPHTVLSALTNPRGGDDLKGTHGLSNYPQFPRWAEKLGWSNKRWSEWLVDWLDMPEKVKGEIFGEPPNPLKADPVLVTKWYNELTSVYNSLGICMFAGTVADALGPTIQSKLYSSATGIQTSPEALMMVGERIFNLMRVYVVREGVTRENDHWPSHFYTETSLTGAPPFDKAKIQGLLDRYYDVRGWERDSGVPKHETLVKLGLKTREKS